MTLAAIALPQSTVELFPRYCGIRIVTQSLLPPLDFGDLPLVNWHVFGCRGQVVPQIENELQFLVRA